MVASRRPKAECPKGFKDYFGQDLKRRRQVLTQIAEIFELHGFAALETPAVETVAALGKFLPDSDRPNEGVFAWEDDDQWLALRYDLTAPLSRVAAQFRNELPMPYRRYAMGPVWRNEKPGPGRFRPFYQCDADTVGSASPAADAELCILASHVLIRLLTPTGFASEAIRIRINSRKILDGALEAAGILDPENRAASASQRLAVLRAMDKLDRLGREAVRQLLGAGRKDESGDYTTGAELLHDQCEIILATLAAGELEQARTLRNLRDIVGTSETGLAGVSELEQIMELVDVDKDASAHCTIDPSVVRGLGYYTGPVIEAELGGPEAGPTLGSVAGGGRYDDLVHRFTGQKVPATGLSIGVDRLLEAMKARSTADRGCGPVLVTVMDSARLPRYQEMVTELRQAGICSELFLGNAKNFGRQLKYADKRESPLAVIEGSEEREAGIVQIKDLERGHRIAESASYDEWKSQPAQFSVKRDNLAPEIKRLLAER
ncbi:MAG: histidine--tRNA ligase [Rhodobacteraceae bacterium]|nr:histidine--tRNA ligase [Paracoccaceae bacterium]